MSFPLVGVIGGSGLYEMEELKILEEKKIETPYGAPSDVFIIGELAGRKVVFLPRHGRGHLYSPSEINYRANIYAMKSLGVERILSVSAVGSMKEEIEPGHIVIIDQFIDRTVQRPSTFFHNGIVAHVSFADPVCGELAEVTYQATKKTGASVHKGGTYLCMEGPMFSTRAESHMYRSWGVSCIGMTNYQEAKLAREAEICYTTIALATDYDCWHEGEAVAVEMILEVLRQNVSRAREIIKGTLATLEPKRNCSCGEALKNAILSDKGKISEEAKRRLKPIIQKYL